MKRYHFDFSLLLPGLMLLAGMALLAFGGYSVYTTVSLYIHGQRAAAVVVRNDDGTDGTSCPVFHFRSQDGRDITVALGGCNNPASYSEGNEVTVIYDPQNPTHAAVNDRTLLLWPGVVLLLGVLFGGVPVAAIAYWIRRSRRITWLKTYGQPIEADFDRIALLESGHPSSFHIVCQWRDPATNTVHVFNSEFLFFDPAPYIDRKKLTVMVDPSDFRHYWVNTDFLPSLASG
jgi:hypothetical protein